MKPHALTVKPPGYYLLPKTGCRSIPVYCRRVPEYSGDTRRRDVLIAPLVAVGAYALRSAVAKADTVTNPEGGTTPMQSPVRSTTAREASPAAAKEETMNSRIYDATVIGEPMALGKEKRKAWEKMMNARIVYLGEAEQVPTRDDRELELEIVKNLRKRCLEAERPISLALEAIPSDLQDQLNRYTEKRINGEALKSSLIHWPDQRWQEYEPLLTYCRDNGIRLIACGLPLQVLRTVQAEGVRGLSKADRKKYAPPAGSGFISGYPSISRRQSIDANFSSQFAPYEPSTYLSMQARVVEDYVMSQIILQAVADGGSNGILVVVARGEARLFV